MKLKMKFKSPDPLIEVYTDFEQGLGDESRSAITLGDQFDKKGSKITVGEQFDNKGSKRDHFGRPVW